MPSDDQEDIRLRSVALQNAQAILHARRQAEESLERKSEELIQQREWFEVTLASIGDAVITTDVAGRVIFLNAVAEELTGWKQAEAAGQPLETVFNIINEHTRQRAENPVAKALREGVIVGLANHTALLAKDGRETAIEDSAAPIKNSAGKILGAVMVFHDVTERRAAEAASNENRERLQAMFNQAAVGIATASLQGNFLEANQKLLDILGYSNEEICRMSFGDITHPEDQERTRAQTDRLLAGLVADIVYEKRYIRKDGRIVWSLTTVTLIKDDAGKPQRFVGVIEDITSRKLVELEREQLATVLERSLNEIYIFNTDTLRFDYVNEGALRNLGYTRAEIREKTPLDLKPEFTEAGFREMIRPLLAGEKAKHLFYTFHRRRDGTDYPVEVHLQTVAYGGQRIFLAVILDITERKKAEEGLRRNELELRTLADSMAQLAWIAGPDGNIFWYNRQWYDYTGTTLEQMQGWGWQAVHDPKVLPQVIEQWSSALRAGEPFEMEFPLRGADGNFRWFLTRANPLRDGENRVVRWFGTNTDIEQGKRAEEQLATARDLAEKANAAKDHFLATLSHELRTPLTPVLALLSNLCEDKEVPRHFRDDLETMRRNVELEARLIDDLLDLTRITRGKLELRPSSERLGQMVEDAVNTCLSDMQVKQLTLTRHFENADQMLTVDGARITQILWNLLKNSIKFTPLGGHISIHSTVNAAAGTATIEIRDSGIGIAPEHLIRIFEAFEQGDRLITRQFGGLGLGLAISRAIAGAHGGTLTATSAGLGCGSHFILTLPLASFLELPATVARSGLPKPGGMPLSPAKPLRILLVDDHVDTAAALSILLRRRGYHVSTAGSVKAALDTAATESFDILISDLGLPDATGYDLMRQIRERYQFPGIATSGYGMEEDIRKCHEAGFSGHLVKPVKISQLEDAIARALGR